MDKLQINNEIIRYEGGEQWQELYFSLPDLCRKFGRPKELIANWMRTRSTLNFMGEWEQYYNEDFKVVEFDHLTRYAGDNSFSMSTRKWTRDINGKCIYLKKGRGGGTFGHLLVVLHFTNWLSAKFYLQFTRSYFTLLENRYGEKAVKQQVTRMWAKLNYPLHTEAVKCIG